MHKRLGHVGSTRCDFENLGSTRREEGTKQLGISIESLEPSRVRTIFDREETCLERFVEPAKVSGQRKLWLIAHQTERQLGIVELGLRAGPYGGVRGDEGLSAEEKHGGNAPLQKLAHASFVVAQARVRDDGLAIARDDSQAVAKHRLLERFEPKARAGRHRVHSRAMIELKRDHSGAVSVGASVAGEVVVVGEVTCDRSDDRSWDVAWLQRGQVEVGALALGGNEGHGCLGFHAAGGHGWRDGTELRRLCRRHGGTVACSVRGCHTLPSAERRSRLVRRARDGVMPR